MGKCVIAIACVIVFLNEINGVGDVKCKTLMQDSLAYKSTEQIGQRVPPCGATLYRKLEIFAILGPRSQPLAPIGLKFARSSGPTCPMAVPIMSRESVQRVALRGENVDFWPMSKFKYRLTPLLGK